MGAIAALQFATTWPERVERLILASAMASRLPEEIIQRARVIEQTLAEKGLAEAYEQYFSGALFEGAAANDSFKEKLAGVLEKATPHGFRGCYHVTIDRPSMLESLHKIDAPTLIMIGERDRHYVVEADILLDKITDSRKIVVKNAGHAITVQQPQVFEDAILDFLQQPA
jgi:pimeloyl-ACP methyl ester carboxylesterase